MKQKDKRSLEAFSPGELTALELRRRLGGESQEAAAGLGMVDSCDGVVNQADQLGLPAGSGLLEDAGKLCARGRERDAPSLCRGFAAVALGDLGCQARLGRRQAECVAQIALEPMALHVRVGDGDNGDRCAEPEPRHLGDPALGAERRNHEPQRRSAGAAGDLEIAAASLERSEPGSRRTARNQARQCPVFGFEGAASEREPVPGREQGSSGWIGKNDPRPCIDEHNPVRECIELICRGFSLEIEPANLVLDSHGPVDVLDRKLESAQLRFGNDILARTIVEANQRREPILDQQVRADQGEPASRRLPPFVEDRGFDESLPPDQRLEREGLPCRHGRRSRPEWIAKGPIGLVARQELGIRARRDRGEGLRAIVERCHRHLPGPERVGELRQHPRPEVGIESGLPDRIDQADQRIIQAHPGPSPVPYRSLPSLSRTRGIANDLDRATTEADEGEGQGHGSLSEFDGPSRRPEPGFATPPYPPRPYPPRR